MLIWPYRYLEFLQRYLNWIFYDLGFTLSEDLMANSIILVFSFLHGYGDASHLKVWCDSILLVDVNCM